MLGAGMGAREMVGGGPLAPEHFSAALAHFSPALARAGAASRALEQHRGCPSAEG